MGLTERDPKTHYGILVGWAVRKILPGELGAQMPSEHLQRQNQPKCSLVASLIQCWGQQVGIRSTRKRLMSLDTLWHFCRRYWGWLRHKGISSTKGLVNTPGLLSQGGFEASRKKDHVTSGTCSLLSPGKCDPKSHALPLSRAGAHKILWAERGEKPFLRKVANEEWMDNS